MTKCTCAAFCCQLVFILKRLHYLHICICCNELLTSWCACLHIHSGREMREQLHWRRSLDTVSALPQKGGSKDYEPDGSWLQQRRLENFYSERLSILQEERVHTQCVFFSVFVPFLAFFQSAYEHVHYKPGARFEKYLMTILRLSYNNAGRLIYRTSYEECKASLR